MIFWAGLSSRVVVVVRLAMQTLAWDPAAALPVDIEVAEEVGYFVSSITWQAMELSLVVGVCASQTTY